MKLIRHSALVAALTLLPAINAVPQTQTQPRQSAAAGHLPGLLEKTGHAYRKSGEGVWIVTLAGKNVKEIDIVVQPAEDMVTLQAHLVERKAVADKAGLLLKLLELNHHYDTVKLAVSPDMLYARAEIHSRLLDAELMNYLINQVGVVVDEAEPQLRALFKAGQAPGRNP